MKKSIVAHIRFDDVDSDLFDWLLSDVLGWNEKTREDVYLLEIWPEDANRLPILAQTIDTVPTDYFEDFIQIHQALRSPVNYDTIKIYKGEDK